MRKSSNIVFFWLIEMRMANLKFGLAQVEWGCLRKLIPIQYSIMLFILPNWINLKGTI